jgi:dimethylhistidine N-methyltransferase
VHAAEVHGKLTVVTAPPTSSLLPDHAAPTTPGFADAVRAGLTARPKWLPPKYFYDPLGSSLFDAICRLPWYEITRAEGRLLARHAGDIASGSRALVDLGCGSGDKIAMLAEAATSGGGPCEVHLVDVSAAALRTASHRLATIAGVSVVAHEADYVDGLRALARQRPADSMLVAFLGSNIGNLDPTDAHAFLCAVRDTLVAGDRFLLGADLVKPEAVLRLAYDDPLGVTAAFNKNLLVRINRELGATVDLGAFDHRAVWNAADSRVEMHLVSRTRQTVAIPGAGCVAEFEAGEAIVTEHSYKYDRDELRSRGERAGFRVVSQWVEPASTFSLTLFVAV